MTVRSTLQPCPIFAQNFWLAGLTMVSQEQKPFAGSIRQFGRGDQQSMAEYSHASRQPIHKMIIVFIKAGLVQTRFPARGAVKRELFAVM